MSNRENVIAILFADPDYIGEAGFWFTSDDQAFTDKNKGLGALHAKTLEDKELVWVGRNLTPPAPSPSEMGSLDALVSTGVETPVNVEPSADVETPMNVEPSADVETPVNVEPSADVETPVNVEPSADVETPVNVEPSADVETPADVVTDAPAEVVVEKKSE